MSRRSFTENRRLSGFFLLSLLIGIRSLSATDQPSVELEPGDRILIMAPHPDDEIIGCGGIIQKALAKNLPVHVLFLTYGDNNQWSFMVYRGHPVLKPEAVRQMGLVRHDEAIRATAALGLEADRLTFLGYPDFGTLSIWNAHWGADAPAFESMLTRVRNVPYPNAFRPGAPYKGEEILKDITTILKDFKPTKVFVSHPADFHYDHRALYLFTRIALWDLESEIRPDFYPYLVHFRRWPARRGFLPNESLNPPVFFDRQIAWKKSPLSPEEVSRKYEAIQQHKTQYEYAAPYLSSFVRTRELFGDFPDVVFAPSNPSPTDLAQGPSDASSDGGFPEQLTDEERASFVGVEWRSAAVESNDLVVTIALSRPLAKTVSASLFVFGYRPDRPFEDMPKIHVKLGMIDYDVLDQNRKLSHSSVVVRRQPKEITVRIPLAALGGPTKILTSARTYLGEVPLDWVSWRILDFPLNIDRASAQNQEPQNQKGP